MADQGGAPDFTSPPTAAVQPDTGQGQPSVDPSAVQPPEGQGQSGASLYDEALSTVPEELRQHVEPHFKAWDQRVQPKLTEFADYRKRWEAYEAIEGLEDAGADGVAALLEFARKLEDPESARDALLGLAANLEIDLTKAAPSPDGGGDDPVESLRAQVEALQQSLVEQDRQKELEQLQQEQLNILRTEWAAVAEEHEKATGRKLDPQVEGSEGDKLKRLAQFYIREGVDNPIKEAYAFMQGIVGGAEAALVENAPTPPRPAAPAGRADTTVKPVDSFDEAERLMRERRAAALAA